MKHALCNSPAELVHAAEFDMVAAFTSQVLDRKRGPLYRQIGDILREPMEAGDLRPGQTLPREADLAKMFGVSLITIRQALRDLETEGWVRKQSAKPTIVTVPPAKPDTCFSFENLESIIASTAGRRIRIVDYRQRNSARAREVFGLARTENVWCLEAVLYSSTQKVSQNLFYFPPAIGASLRREDFGDAVVFRSVQHRLGLKLRNAHVTVRAEIADAKLAALLDCRQGAPIMAIEMIYYNTDGEPVELSINYNRADAFSLEFDAPNDQK